MKKCLIAGLLCLMFLAFVLPVSASSHYVIDHAGLLTENQQQELEERCALFHSEYGMDLVLLTVNGLNGKTPMVYADDYFDANYGAHGILLLINIGERDWYISVTGNAIDAFIDNDLINMEEDLLPYLSSGRFYDGFENFISDAEYYVADEPVSDLEAILFMTIPAGAVVAGIVLLIMRGTMNTKTAQRGATNYEIENSYHLRTHQDLFLYSNVTKRPKPQNNTSGGGTHRSSSGHTHSGRGGKF